MSSNGISAELGVIMNASQFRLYQQATAHPKTAISWRNKCAIHSQKPTPPAKPPLVLSRIYAAPITRLGCLAFEGQGAFAPQS